MITRLRCTLPAPWNDLMIHVDKQTALTKKLTAELPSAEHMAGVIMVEVTGSYGSNALKAMNLDDATDSICPIARVVCDNKKPEKVYDEVHEALREVIYYCAFALALQDVRVRMWKRTGKD